MVRTLRLIATAVVGALALVASTGPLGCNDEDGSGTTGRRVAVDVRISASPESKSFTNKKGWAVTISKAAIATGAFYFYDGETLFASSGRRRDRGLVASAFAHPGHYVPGNAKGEMLSPSSADLLAGAVLGRGSGVTGLVQSATFGFGTGAAAAGPMAAELGASVVVLEGGATKDLESRPFRLEIRPDELKDAKGIPQIEGCPFTKSDVESDGTVSVTVRLEAWLDQVDFTDVPKSSDGAPVLLGDGLARSQLVRGMRGGLAYRFAFEANAP